MLAKQSCVIQPGAASLEHRKTAIRSLRRRLTRQEIGELVARNDAGEGTPALGPEFGIPASGLRQLLRAEGVTFRRQAITPEDAERAVRLYENCMTIRQVVEQVGNSYGSIQRMLNDKGVALRAGGSGNRAARDA